LYAKHSLKCSRGCWTHLHCLLHDACPTHHCILTRLPELYAPPPHPLLPGNGQINTFTVPCGTRPVVWMKDKSFSSCVREDNIPNYLTTTTGPNQCSGAGESTSNLCGPYALPQLSCAALQPCNPNDKAVVQASVTINNNNWADFTQTCTAGTICR
jgi:hypothetical protein